MKNKKVLIFLLLILITLVSILLIYTITMSKKEQEILDIDEYLDSQEPIEVRAVIIKVKEETLGVMSLDEQYTKYQNGKTENVNLYNISFGNEGNIGFKEGQEIVFYYTGVVKAMSPGMITRS